MRARQVTTEVNGDYGRIKRQQLFLSSLLRSIISKDTLFSLNKLNNVVNEFIDDTYVDNVRTKDLVDLGQSLQGVNAGRITFVTVPTTGITDSDGNEQPPAPRTSARCSTRSSTTIRCPARTTPMPRWARRRRRRTHFRPPSPARSSSRPKPRRPNWSTR